MNRDERLLKLLDASREIIQQAALGNGAILATVTASGTGQRHVWPRVGAFAAVAGQRLNLNIAEQFFHWLADSPEGFHREQLLYSDYATNGQLGTLGRMLAPDQMGTVLWAINRVTQGHPDRVLPFRPLVQRLAEGLTAVWNKTEFIPEVAGLWDDRPQPNKQRASATTYALAACVAGLRVADELIPTKAWKQAAKQMEKQITAAFDTKSGVYRRTRIDATVDASLLGLVWPFEIVDPSNEKILRTVDLIERRLIDGGLHRFEFDLHSPVGSSEDAGGSWPVVNAWMAAVLHRLGQDDRARNYLTWIADHVEREIPLQIFPDFRISAGASVWSHALFILACAELGLIDQS